MSGLLECKYCGAAAEAEGKGWLAECGSWELGREWNRSDGCYLRCAWRSQSLEFDKLRKRIDAAVKALQGMTRHEIEPDDQFGIVDERNEHGEWVKWVDVEDVIEFLTNSPTISESSEG